MCRKADIAAIPFFYFSSLVPLRRQEKKPPYPSWKKLHEADIRRNDRYAVMPKDSINFSASTARRFPVLQARCILFPMFKRVSQLFPGVSICSEQHQNNDALFGSLQLTYRSDAPCPFLGIVHRHSSRRNDTAIRHNRDADSCASKFDIPCFISSSISILSLYIKNQKTAN